MGEEEVESNGEDWRNGEGEWSVLGNIMDSKNSEEMKEANEKTTKKVIKVINQEHRQKEITMRLRWEKFN